MLKALFAPLRWIFRVVFAALILFEEWGWEPLRRVFALLARLPVIRQFEALLKRLPCRLRRARRYEPHRFCSAIGITGTGCVSRSS
jgi:hypothetical protein